jgi:hypothetical protein
MKGSSIRNLANPRFLQLKIEFEHVDFEIMQMVEEINSILGKENSAIFYGLVEFISKQRNGKGFLMNFKINSRERVESIKI